MSKKIFGYTALLYVLKALVYLKKGIFWSLRQVAWGFISLRKLYTRTIGFHIYRLSLSLKKTIRNTFFVHKYSKFEVLGQRGALQLFLFLTIVTIAVPQTKLYSREYTYIPGRKTVLYRLVGPGDLDLALEEILSDNTAITTPEGASAWKQGAIVSQPQGSDSNSDTATELSSISTGGNAITKPVLAPNVDVESLAADVAAQNEDRSSIIVYEVKPGDVIGVIAERFGISVATILQSNNLTARSYIRPGDKLDILPVDGVSYTVRAGDTVSSIASKYSTDPQKVIAFNKLKNDGSDIVIGEELILPGGSAPAPVPVSRPTIVSNNQQNTAFENVVAPPPSINVPAGSTYIWPTAASIITQYYGWRHTGLDIAGAVGTPIYAARSGRVIKSQCGWNGGYGCYVILDHGGSIQTLYAHHSKLYVTVGQDVTQGQTIGLMGSTGRSTGPHLHFEVRIGGSHSNPLSYVRR